jgi:tRNA pseudouridine55 synthase
MEPAEANIFETGQVLLFNKPLNWTSFDLVNKVRFMIRSHFGLKKIKTGHAGTLDPLATGLMILCTGKATKSIDDFMGLEKEYTATIHLGETTPSFDLETEVDGHFPTDHISEEMVRDTLMKFIGEQYQVPPLHSAKFIDGKRAYEFARKGDDRQLDPVKVFFREIELLSVAMPDVRVRILCGKGTYIRSFARDLGKALGSGAYMSDLQRTAIGSYRVEDAMDLERFRLFLEQMKQN